MLTLHVAVSTHWTYTTDLSSNTHAALTFFNPMRGLLFMDSGWSPLSTEQCVYICNSIFLFLERPSDSASVVSPAMLTDVCLPVQILVGTSWRHLWSPWCNWSVYCDCVLSLMNVQWNSSCRHYWGTYLVYVNNVFLKKKSDWMLVLWDHRSERSLTRELRGALKKWTDLFLQWGGRLCLVAYG